LRTDDNETICCECKIVYARDGERDHAVMQTNALHQKTAVAKGTYVGEGCPGNSYIAIISVVSVDKPPGMHLYTVTGEDASIGARATRRWERTFKS